MLIFILMCVILIISGTIYQYITSINICVNIELYKRTDNDFMSDIKVSGTKIIFYRFLICCLLFSGTFTNPELVLYFIILFQSYIFCRYTLAMYSNAITCTDVSEIDKLVYVYNKDSKLIIEEFSNTFSPIVYNVGCIPNELLLYSALQGLSSKDINKELLEYNSFNEEEYINNCEKQIYRLGYDKVFKDNFLFSNLFLHKMDFYAFFVISNFYVCFKITTYLYVT